MTNININELIDELRTYKIEELAGIKKRNLDVLRNQGISAEDKIKIMALSYLAEEELKRVEDLFKTTPQPIKQYIH